MTTRVNEVSKEALAPVIEFRIKAVELAQAAEIAIKNARTAELEYQVRIQKLYIDHGLTRDCKVDINTGAITWPEDKHESEDVASEDATKEDVKEESDASEDKKEE